ncbi:U6 snRNA phosphodiesterase Usb1 [Talaromyces proteolyticus]|uniref:U6 snRNA phosphodiesterase n=1 Tax=Talaromyces proteolyticus TaxID=1131652 RepID=A0AAD4KI75_9EURO|nr:U6 snRNA phosphodiesterase Usb1 [Talaromyces proteolyticus]KAH8689033.1 U6 snRNA phosphodiesterase Usb1 [Talaromyces proteolyticus]
MALVQYSDSDSEHELDDERVKIDLSTRKKLRGNSTSMTPADSRSSLPPLPTGFHDLYASSTRVSVRDDPSLHGGRKRVIPHVEGNWPTHIYLEWSPRREEMEVLSDVVQRCKTKLADDDSHIHSLLHSDLGVQLPLHISLSRPVVLATEQKHAFAELFENSIQESPIKPFTVIPETLDWVSNSEKTRWFLVMRIRKPPNDELNALLRISNQTLAKFNQPSLYESQTSITRSSKKRGSNKNLSLAGKYSNDDVTSQDLSDRFHISLAWCLDEPSLEIQEKTSGIDVKPLQSLKIIFNSVKAKIGNVVKSFNL